MIRTRRLRTPEECIATVKLDRAGLVVLGVCLSVSGLIVALLVRAVSG